MARKPKRVKAAPAPAAAPDAAAIAAVLGPFAVTALSSDEQKYIALDCEMVGVGAEGKRSILAQVVAVDWAGEVRYCQYVQPGAETVTDYRTQFSGVRPENLRPGVAVPFSEAQAAIAALIGGRIVVGHGLSNDMQALQLSHPWTSTRDTARYRPFCRPNRTGKLKPRRLKHLTEEHLGVVIQVRARPFCREGVADA